jgi:hypothetical protein
MMSLQMNENMEFFEVAMIKSNTETRERVMRFKLKGSGSTTIPIWSPKMEPLSYPLLFSTGENGWGKDDDHPKPVDFMKYLSSRLLQAEPSLELPSKLDHAVKLKCNRFTAMHRLGQ